MNPKPIATWTAVCLIFAAAFPVAALAQQARVGGYAKAQVTSAEVVAAAGFAVKAQEQVLRQQQKEGVPPKVELVSIVDAEAQVVAGMNYRLQLKVKLNGKEKTAHATVWWQAWRKPEPYALTAWEWK